MGRSFESVRMGVREVAERWTRVKRALKREDQVYADRLLEKAWSETSFAFERLRGKNHKRYSNLPQNDRPAG